MADDKNRNPPKTLTKAPWFREFVPVPASKTPDSSSIPKPPKRKVFVDPITPPPSQPQPQFTQPKSQSIIPNHPSDSNEALEGRFPVRLESQTSTEHSPTTPSPDSKKSQREVELESRMILLEKDYVSSAKSWRESALAMVRALEILESRIGAQTGQPLAGMGQSDLNDQLTDVRFELAQLSNRVDGLLPPPPSNNQSQLYPNSSTPTSSPNIFQPPPHNPQNHGPVFNSVPPQYKPQNTGWTPPKPAKIRNSTGQGFLFLLIVVFSIAASWYVANSIDNARNLINPQSFYDFMKGKSSNLATVLKKPKAKTALHHYKEGEIAYRNYKRTKNPHSLEKAQNHFKIAAGEGLTAARYYLGYFYEKGEGVKLSLEKAVSFYTEAAKMGHVLSQHQLGILYLEGRGVDYDIAAASEWLLKSAGFGFAESMNKLGFINETGKLGERNIIHAYAWYRLAARLGHKSASEHLPRVAVSLSRRNILEAEALINSWRIREADPLVNGTAEIFNSSSAKPVLKLLAHNK